MTKTAKVHVAQASAAERGVLENLFQLYIHDFSEHWSGTPNGELGEDGRFAPYPLDSYWRHAGHVPLLIRVDGRLAGFVLLNTTSHTGQTVDHNMAEFFIVRKHRGGGVGTAVAAAVFALYPGVWETAVARRNFAGLAFWRRVVSQHRRVFDLRESDEQTSDWTGPVLRFRVD